MSQGFSTILPSHLTKYKCDPNNNRPCSRVSSGQATCRLLKDVTSGEVAARQHASPFRKLDGLQTRIDFGEDDSPLVPASP